MASYYLVHKVYVERTNRYLVGSVGCFVDLSTGLRFIRWIALSSFEQPGPVDQCQSGV